MKRRLSGSKSTFFYHIFAFGFAIGCSGLAFGQDRPDLPENNRLMSKPMAIDADRVQAHGIDVVHGTFVDLYSDVRDARRLEELVAIYDAAVPLWCGYFDVDFGKTKSWRMRGFLIGDRQRFVDAGLIPDDLPDFLAGFHRGHEMWLYVQPDDYYTQHLLLHEGTHAFMTWLLGGLGPAWYSEGMAEMLAVHRWHDGTLQLNYRLRDRTESPGWGRIKKLREDCADSKAMTLLDVLQIENSLFGRDVRYYAWSWAACRFFSEHEKTKVLFKTLKNNVTALPGEFNRAFEKQIEPDRLVLERDWQLYLHEVDYGYSVELAEICPAIEAGPSNQFSIDSRRGWQNTNVRVSEGDCFSVSASGRFRVAQLQLDNNQTETWPCEAGGITIDYYRGKPLGMLLTGVLDDQDSVSGLLDPIPVGLGRSIKFTRSGTICLRINESPARLDDNQGCLTVTLEKE